MRILIPTVDYPPIEGGIGTVTLEVSRELARLGHEVTVVAPWFPGMRDFDAAEPVRVERFRGYQLGWLRYVPLWLRSRPWLRTCDLIVAPNVAYGGLMAQRCQRPYITFAYAYEFLKFERRAAIANLLRRVYRDAGVVIAISGYTRARLEAFGVSPESIATILPGAHVPPVVPPNAHEICRKLGVDAANVILAVGRMVPRKGHAALIQAMTTVVRDVPDTQLVIVGRGPCEASLRRAAIAQGMANHIVFTGRVSDEELAALYNCCTVFALPTGDAGGGQVEGFGLVFTEAHAHGKPVIGGRSGGVEDAVIDGHTGILVDPNDTDSLARAIVHLLQHPEEACRLGEAGRARVESELNWSVFTRKMLEAWEARR